MAKASAKARARRDAAHGKSASTQAGEFVKDEIDTIRRGGHGVANAKQAIAIGLSKARRAGVKVGANPKRKTKKKKTKASSESRAKRSKASLKALKRKPRAGASHRALSRQAKAAARRQK